MEENYLFQKILNEPFPLSAPQKDAIMCETARVRVVAGAGAGKTETLTRKVVYLLLEKNVDPSEIVAFTFTEKAAQSMKSRIYNRISHFGKSQVCSRLGDMYVGTIHAYCAQLLEEHFGYGGYEVLDENQEMAYLHRAIWGMNILPETSISQKCRIFAKNQAMVYAEMIPDQDLYRHSPGFYRAREKYVEGLDGHRRLTFDRMIDLAVKSLEKEPQVVNNIHHLIVDEYQDINHAQEKLIHLLAKNAQLFVVGDPRQTIYQWRGSDERCFENFGSGNNAATTTQITITENRRSTKRIVEVANEFASTFEGTCYDPMETTRTEIGAAYFVEINSDQSEVEWIANQIESYLNENACSYGNIAILLRSVNTSGPLFIDEFRRRGFPYIVGGKVGLFRRPEVQAVGKLFAWISGDAGFFQKNRWDFQNQIRGEDLLDSSLMDWGEIIAESDLIENIVRKLEIWRQNVLDGMFSNFTQAYYALLEILSYKLLDPETPADAVVMANLGRFSALLTDYETAIMLGGKRRNWASNMKGLCWFINTYATSAYEEQQSDDLRGVNAIQLMTIHQSKGLEWPLVFVPCMVEGRFPSSQVGQRQTWLIPEDMFDRKRYEGDLDSERKLVYVACTRAKDVLVVSQFKTMNGRSRSASEFLTEGTLRQALTPISEQDRLPFHALTHGGDAEEIETYVTGELISYGKCPYMYQMNMVWGFEPGLKPLIGYGKALHHCLRVAADLMRDEGIDPITAVAEAVDADFHLPFVDGPRLMRMREIAKEKLMAFAIEREEDMRRIREVESRIEYPLQQAILVGKADVILHDDVGIEVRDYKTSDRVITEEEAAFQVRIYSRGLSAMGESVSKGTIAYLEDLSIADVGVSDQELQNADNLAEERISGIRDRNFRACPGGVCETCNYTTICRFKEKFNGGH